MAIAARGSRAEHTGSDGTEGFPAAWAGFMNEGAAPGCHSTPPGSSLQLPGALGSLGANELEVPGPAAGWAHRR